jgi:hypothetical protein
MFTGLIEELGRVRSVERRGEGVRMTLEARVVTEGTHDGDSVAVNGVCLTALEVRADSFAADGSRETLQRSTLGLLRAGSSVNLERAVTPSTRLGGHIVQGHVDARGRFLSAEEHGGSWTLRVGYPPELSALPRLQGLGRGRGHKPHHRRARRRALRGRNHPEDVGRHEPLALKTRRPGQPRSRHHRQVRRAHTLVRPALENRRLISNNRKAERVGIQMRGGGPPPLLSTITIT